MFKSLIAALALLAPVLVFAGIHSFTAVKLINWLVSGIIRKSLFFILMLLTVISLAVSTAVFAHYRKITTLPVILTLLIAALPFCLAGYHKTRSRKDGDAMDEAEILGYKKKIIDDPGNWGAHEFLGDIYFRKGKYEFALDEYKKAVKISGGNSGLEYKLNQALKALGAPAGPAAEKPGAE